jgi:hypothetical protein
MIRVQVSQNSNHNRIDFVDSGHRIVEILD